MSKKYELVPNTPKSLFWQSKENVHEKFPTTGTTLLKVWKLQSLAYVRDMKRQF